MKGEFSMSNKLKNKGIVPTAMSGKVFSSLSDLGEALGFKSAERPTAKAMKCRKCGTVMRNIPGTNVWMCDGQVIKVDGDTKKMVPCGNRAMTSTHPATQSSENPGNFKPNKNQGKNTGKPAQAATA